ncbi:replicative DNA helicase [Mycoplasmopsis phocirhinis]|uniref:DNA 5'-3' helicase n=1 Tax=Mycoplasmopsis phocirhinis TaxID=142650 RepID=A0A4P6MPU6_9BACT|nr:replicative DNA helicase [Mycoplasmopsis phocirhinis]QBF34766.1 replicative DNA helicase [Mycoplasmopsis phocirhinis]
MSNNNFSSNEKPLSHLKSTKHINLAYEYAVLGLILSNENLAHNIIPFMQEQDFGDLACRQLFAIMSGLYEADKNINNETILASAQAKNHPLVNTQLLVNIYSSNALRSNIQMYLEELERLTRLRTLEFEIDQIKATLQNSRKLIDPDEMVIKIQELLQKLDRAKSGNDFHTTQEVSDKYFEKLQKLRASKSHEISGIKTGYVDFDQITQGLHSSELIVLAARPGIGKTAFALNIAINVAKQKKKNDPTRQNRVAFFSLEMSPEQLMGRIYSITTNIEQNRLKKPQDPKYGLSDHDILKITHVKRDFIDKMQLFIDNTYDNDIDTILWKCRRLHKKEKLDLIVVDYMQLISGGKGHRGENRQLEITRISRNLKTLSLELEVPIIVLSQLNRQTETREDKRPMLADLRESGSIENDADIVMFLYREDYYNRKNKNIINQEFKGSAGEPVDLIIAKHRAGETGVINLRMVLKFGRFENREFDKFINFDEDDE